MRLDKFLCSSTELTRSQAKACLRRGEVTVDGEVVKDSGFKVSDELGICLQGEPLTARGQRYIMLHKPVDTVCSTVDDTYISVLSLLLIDKPEELHIAGRLDADTTGLVLITSDGKWSHQVTSPNKHCAKRYRVSLADPLSDDAAQQLREGVMLHGEPQLTRPAELDVLSEKEVFLTISEGKYHQVKRMFAAVGNKVMALHRDRVGAISLDPDLEEGEWRYLKPEEIAAFS